MTQAKFQSKQKINPIFWVSFVLAIASLSKFFGGHRYIAQGDEFAAKVFIPLSICVFVVSMVIMAFIIYSEEKDKSNLVANIAVFDKVYDLLNRGKNKND